MTATPGRRVTLRPADDPAEWDDAVRRHPDGTPFHLSGFLTTYARLFGVELLMGQALLDGEPVGVVPLMIRQRGPLLLLNHGLGIPYLDPLLFDGVSLDDVLPAVRRHLRPRPVARYTVRSIRDCASPDGPAWRALPGYVRAVLPVPDADHDDVTAGFSAKQRSAARKVERSGLTAGPATRREIADHMTAWANAPYLRQGLPPSWPEGAHLAIHDALAASGATQTTAVRQDGEVVAMSINLQLNGRLTGWEMGLSDAGRRARASVLLVVDGLRLAQRAGCTEYDLLGIPTAGIAEFKRSLGAEFRSYGAAQWTSAAARAVPWVQRLGRRAVRGARPRRARRVTPAPTEPHAPTGGPSASR